MMAFAFAKNKIALALGAAVVLSVHGHAHADVSSGQHRNGDGHGDPASSSAEGAGISHRTHIQLQIISSWHQYETNSNDEDGNRNIVMTVTSNFDPGNFFRKDYLYTIHSPSRIGIGSGEQRHQWQVQRLPRPARTLHAATQSEADNVTEPSARQDGGGEYVGTFTNSLAVVIATNALAASVCVMLIALAGGLNQGMLSLDPVSLEIKRRASPNPEEQRWSSELLPLLVGHSKPHRLLWSLLLLDSIANAALPLFLDGLYPSRTTTFASIVTCTTLVLLFGEILPGAFFMGPRQVEIAARQVPLAKAIMFVFTPIALPITKLLDWILHKRDCVGNAVKHARTGSDDVTAGRRYTRKELSALVRIQYESQLLEKRKRKQELTMSLRKSTIVPAPSSTQKSNSRSDSDSELSILSSNYSHHFIRTVSKELVGSHPPNEEQKKILHQRIASIQQGEIAMIEGALTMNAKVAAEVVTPLRKVYSLPSDVVLNEDTMVEIWRSGYSRIPVYLPNATTDSLVGGSSPSDFDDTSRVVGVLMVRQLIVINHADNISLDALPLAVPPCISPTMTLVDLITLFQADGGRGGRALHLALVCARPQLATEALEQGEHIPREAGVAGIITLEDVVEELLQGEIYDETGLDLELSRFGVDKLTRDVNKKKMSRLHPHLESAGATEKSPLIE